jgi:bacterioferritin-associated ferredoxin
MYGSRCNLTHAISETVSRCYANPDDIERVTTNGENCERCNNRAGKSHLQCAWNISHLSRNSRKKFAILRHVLR